MNPTLRNVLAVIGSLVIGGIINMGIIILGSNIVPPPEGVDPMNMESIKANVHLYSYKHFIIPFLAHSLGTLIGAFAVSKLAVSHHKNLALVIGIVFLLGGLSMAISLPEFLKYSILDILLAYIPMAIWGWNLAGQPK